jgi:hypothetical protein
MGPSEEVDRKGKGAFALARVAVRRYLTRQHGDARMSETTNTDQAPGAPAAATRPPCQNCGAPLLGDHCYACGQPVKGLVRHFSSILGDFLDSVFNIDARVFRTLWPLFAKPGYLSSEYFEGHRVRFVSPVRLFVFLTIVTFFVAQLSLDFGSANIGFNGQGNSAIASAKTVEEAVKARDDALAELEKARRDAGDTPGVGVGLEAAAAAIREQTDERIEKLRARAPAASATGATPPSVSASVDLDEDDTDLRFNDRPWDPVTNPIKVPWLPRVANNKLNDMAGHAKENVHRMQRNPNLFKDAVLSAVPSTLFVLMPVFALMLKVAYALKRRLYMEHLIVALHSHAFLCLSLLLMFIVMALEDAIAAPGSALRGPFTLVETALWIWMPLYLLIMQKRVYGQGWAMTVLKYCVLGICYFILLSFGAAFTMLASLVWM